MKKRNAFEVSADVWDRNGRSEFEVLSRTGHSLQILP